MCVSYKISLCLCEIRIYFSGLFTFAKIPDNNINVYYTPLSSCCWQYHFISKILKGFCHFVSSTSSSKISIILSKSQLFSSHNCSRNFSQDFDFSVKMRNIRNNSSRHSLVSSNSRSHMWEWCPPTLEKKISFHINGSNIF